VFLQTVKVFLATEESMAHRALLSQFHQFEGELGVAFRGVRYLVPKEEPRVCKVWNLLIEER
jgi:hypothetical protein